MKRMKGTKIIAGALIPTILFPSCSGFIVILI